MKTLGGVRYTYAVKDGDAVRPSSIAPVEPAERQRDALDAVLETLDPKALVLPDRLLDLIPPQAFNRPEGTAERFTGKTGLVFDPVAAAVTAADLAVSGLLNPQRAARLADFHARDPRLPGFDEVVAALVKKTWDDAPDEGRAGEIARAVQWLVVTRLIGLAGDDGGRPARPSCARGRAGRARSTARDPPFARGEPSDRTGLPRLGDRARNPPVPQSSRPDSPPRRTPG